MSGLLLSSDLMFSSRVVGIARQLGSQVQVARTLEDAVDNLPSELRLVMVDLFRFPPAQLNTLMALLAEQQPRPHVVAYGPHVDETTLSEARDLGCDEVLTRGQFNQQMGQLMAERLN